MKKITLILLLLLFLLPSAKPAEAEDNIFLIIINYSFPFILV